jgi:FkbH-like protein
MYDFNRSVFGLGIDRSYNFNLGHLYQMPYTKELIDVVTYQIKAYLDFLILPERKAIFLDCDNTLWNGIVGEDGVNGIRCDKNSEGIVYYYFQQFLLKKKKEGFLLCLCSKNNEDEVKNAFEELNMPLKWADFIIKKINWEDKPNNLKAAANELNIGTESFIFIDDSDFELQYVNSILPEIKILKFEKNYKQFLNLIDDFAFKRKVLTPEDFEKNKQYIAEKERKELQINSISFDRYLKSLEIKLEISVNNLNDLVRLSQLTEKTNQFNFNKEHFSVKQLEEFIKDNNLIYSLKVSDKFSDYGTVGLILIEVKGEKAVLRNYLMSCRALGRNIENDFFQNVKILLKDKKIEIDSIIFNESSKNEPAKQFYQKIKNER